MSGGSFHVYATVTEDDRDWLGWIATRRGLSRSELIREALNHWLAAHGESLLMKKRPVGRPETQPL